MMFKNLPRNVFLLGLVSFFNDVAADMIYPIVPIFLTSVLGAPMAIVGIIEGIAEGTAALGKFLFGWLSDKIQKRKIFVVWGYSFASISKLLITVALSWHFVLLARFIDRMGKGLRTSPRDALLLGSANANNRGFIFGFHRAMDSAGGVIGPLLGIILVVLLKDNFRLIFLISFIPAVVGVVLLVVLVKEKAAPIKEKITINLNWKKTSRAFKIFFLISFIFALGNSSDAFLILRAKDLGLATSLTVMTYVLYNLIQTVFATPLGKLSDRIGAKKVYTGGLLVFAVVYLGFGLARNPLWLWILFPVYGLYIAATDGVAKAYISNFIKKEEAGTYFGLYQTGIAIASFFASFIGGILWQVFGSQATFYYGAIMAMIAFISIYFY